MPANPNSSPLARRPGTPTSSGLARLRHALMTCRHCGGSGKEPSPLSVEFPRGEQDTAAKEIGISPAMLSYILSGERGPSVLTLIKMARYFRTTVDRVVRIPAIWRRVHQSGEEQD